MLMQHHKYFHYSVQMCLHQFIVNMESGFFTATLRGNLNTMDGGSPSWEAVPSSDVRFFAVRPYVVAHSPCGCLPLLEFHMRKADGWKQTAPPPPASLLLPRTLVHPRVDQCGSLLQFHIVSLINWNQQTLENSKKKKTIVFPRE